MKTIVPEATPQGNSPRGIADSNSPASAKLNLLWVQTPEARLPTAKRLAPWTKGWGLAFDQLMDAGATPEQAHDALGPQPLTDSGLTEEQCAEWAQWIADNPDKVAKLGEGR